VGWLTFLICAVPLYLLYNTGRPILWVMALVNSIANIWSYGVMHNYAAQSPTGRIKLMRENLDLEGRLDDDKERELAKLQPSMNLQAVPGWLTTVNMVTFLIGIGFLCYGIWRLL
jgi:hypothetical protein